MRVNFYSDGVWPVRGTDKRKTELEKMFQSLKGDGFDDTVKDPEV